MNFGDASSMVYSLKKNGIHRRKERQILGGIMFVKETMFRYSKLFN